MKNNFAKSLQDWNFALSLTYQTNQKHRAMRVTANFETTTYKGYQINVAKHEECGWYVETSDGYASEYYTSKQDACAKRAQIKREIKNGTW